MKRTVYIIASTFLGVLLGVIIHGIVEKIYINQMLTSGTLPVATVGNCFLPLYLQLTFFLGGAFLGFFLGIHWWRMVYIEKRHWSYKKHV